MGSCTNSYAAASGASEGSSDCSAVGVGEASSGGVGKRAGYDAAWSVASHGWACVSYGSECATDDWASSASYADSSEGVAVGNCASIYDHGDAAVADVYVAAK